MVTGLISPCRTKEHVPGKPRAAAAKHGRLRKAHDGVSLQKQGAGAATARDKDSADSHVERTDFNS